MAAGSFVVVIVGAVTILSAGCSHSSPPTTSSEATTTSAPASPTTPTASAPSACSNPGGRVGPDQICTVHTDASGYTIDMSFPTDYPDQKALSGVLTRQRDQFVQTVTEPPVRDVAKALDITSTTYRSGRPESGTDSVVLEEFVNVGGAHPETYYDALNYDLATQAPVTLATLFKPGADVVAVLDPIVQRELTNRLQGIQIDANPVGADMYKNFALTDDAVIFFIGQGMWTIEAAGPQQVSVPRDELCSILA